MFPPPSVAEHVNSFLRFPLFLLLLLKLLRAPTIFLSFHVFVVVVVVGIVLSLQLLPPDQPKATFQGFFLLLSRLQYSYHPVFSSSLFSSPL